MKDELVSFELAVLTKEIEFGFPIDCDCYSTKGKLIKKRQIARDIEDVFCPAPTQSLLQRWFREKYKIYIFITKGEFGFVWKIPGRRDGGFYETYEKALDKGLIEACKILKEKL